jgi:hypothetical protein
MGMFKHDLLGGEMREELLDLVLDEIVQLGRALDTRRPSADQDKMQHPVQVLSSARFGLAYTTLRMGEIQGGPQQRAATVRLVENGLLFFAFLHALVF